MFKKISFLTTLVIIILLNLYSLKPIVNSGYYFDDTHNSQTRAHLDFFGLSTSQYNNQIINEWLQSGRIIPGAMYGYLPWLYIPLIKYKIIIVSFHIITMLTFSLFLYLLTKSASFSLMYLLMIPIFFQFRHSPDSVTSFGILMPLIALKLSISLLFLQKYLEKNKGYFLIISLLFYLLMLLMFYEITYLFFPLIFYLIYLKIKSIKKAIKIFSPYLFLSLIFIFLYFFVSLKAPNHYSGSTINFDLKLIIPTFLKQVYSTLPLGYYLSTTKVNNFSLINQLDYFVFVICSFFSFILLSKVKLKKTIPLIVIGLLIVFIPALPIALSLRYQLEVAWGRGYLPVYMQYFGGGLFFLGIIISIFNKIKVNFLKIFLIGIFSLSLGLIAFINLQNNKIVIEDLNAGFKYPRDIIEKALVNNLLASVKEGSTILSLNGGPWDNDAYYYSFTDKKISILTPDKYFETKNLNDNLITKKNTSNLYILSYQAINKDLGFAFLGKINEIYYDPISKASVQNVDNVKIFIHKNKVYDYIKCMVYPTENSSRKKAVRVETIKLEDLEPVSKSNDDEVYNLVLNNRVVDFDSIKLVNAHNESEMLANNITLFSRLPIDGYAFFWEGDFSGLENNEKESWRWSGKKGILKIINIDKYNKNILINMHIKTGYEKNADLTIENTNFIEQIKINNIPILYTRSVSLSPGKNYFIFQSDAKKINAPADPRDLRFKISDFESKIMN